MTVLPLAFPFGLLIVGSAIGFPFALTQRVAVERLGGVALAALLSCAALAWLRGAPPGRTRLALTALVAVSVAGAAWIVLLDPLVFRGPLGAVLNRALAPVLGAVPQTEQIDVVNTRFIAGYNGMADLCLAVLFGAAGIALATPGRAVRVASGVTMAVALVVLVGTGSRGGLAGLAVGAGMAALLLPLPRGILQRASRILFEAAPDATAVGLHGRFRGAGMLAAAALVALAVAAALALFLLLDKGLDLSSTTGRFAYWADLSRLLAEFPFTGVGLGTDAANRTAMLYEINPDPERIAYAHNTFVQTYLEQGPLGTLGMLLVPLIGAYAVWITRRSWRKQPPTGAEVALLVTGAALGAALEVHGLTDQVLTTTGGTALLGVAAAFTLAAMRADGHLALAAATRRASLGLGATLAVGLLVIAVLPAGRALAALNWGSLQLTRVQLDNPAPDRDRLASAEAALSTARALAPGSAAPLRNLARVRLARFDAAGSLELTRQASTTPGLDAFDTLQVARLYRELGFSDEAYRLAARAYDLWGRPPNLAVMQAYREATVRDDFRVRDLAAQAEDAIRNRRWAEAQTLFRQALQFAPENAYLRDRLADADRGFTKEGPVGPTPVAPPLPRANTP